MVKIFVGVCVSALHGLTVLLVIHNSLVVESQNK